jgi:hypothetical protein
MTERKIRRKLIFLEEQIQYYARKIENKNDWFEASNIAMFRKYMGSYIRQKRELQQEYPEYFI